MFKSWRPRWWHWAIAFIALIGVSLTGFVLAVRSQSVSRYDEAIRDLRASGKPVDFDDYRKKALPVDQDRQLRYGKWQDRFKEALGYSDFDLDDAEVERWLAGLGEEPKSLQEKLDERHDLIEEGFAIMREGPIVAGQLGWLGEVPNGITAVAALKRLRFADSTVAKYIANWLRFSAYRAKDPGPVLDRFDLLLETLSHPGCAIDELANFCVQEIRDETFLQLIVSNRLAGDRVTAWLSEPAAALSREADLMECERLLDFHNFGERLRAASLWSSWEKYYGRGLSPVESAQQWMFGLSQHADQLEFALVLERRLRDSSAPIPSLRARTFGSLMAEYDFWTNHLRFAFEFDAERRLSRLGALVYLAWKKNGGVLPATETELRGLDELNQFSPSDDLLALRYELLAQGHCRIRVDLSAPLPKILEPIGYFTRTPTRSPVVAPSRATVLIFERQSLELRVPTHP